MLGLGSLVSDDLKRTLRAQHRMLEEGAVKDTSSVSQQVTIGG